MTNKYMGTLGMLFGMLVILHLASLPIPVLIPLHFGIDGASGEDPLRKILLTQGFVEVGQAIFGRTCPVQAHMQS